MVADIAVAGGACVEGFVDIDHVRVGNPVNGWPVLPEQELWEEVPGTYYPTAEVALGIGANGPRIVAAERLGDRCASPLVHPTAVVSPFAVLGRGAVIFPNAIVNANAILGVASIVNSGAVVEHDCRLGDGVHVSPGAVLSGSVEVGRLSWIGAGAVVIPGVRIGAGVMVGAGAVIIRDVKDGVTMVGNPGRPVKSAMDAATGPR